MSLFEGNAEHSLDVKWRLNVPTRYRELLNEVYDTDVIKVIRWENCLRAYPLPEWNDLMRRLESDAVQHPQRRSLVRHLISTVSECLMDKQGRILLPPQLRTLAGIDKDVVVSGYKEHFEIWDRTAWQREFTEVDYKVFEEVLDEAGLL